jgi:hypothetical protein
MHERVEADRLFARVPERSGLVERSLKATVTVHATEHPILYGLPYTSGATTIAERYW